MTSGDGQADDDNGAVGDDPIQRPTQDRLSRRGFAARMAEAIHAVHSSETSCVFALAGPWGSGKTSVLNLARGDLPTGDSEWTVVDFSPWMVTDLEALVGDFFAALQSALGSDPTMTRRLGDLAGQLVPASKLLKLVGLDITTALETLKEGLAPTKSLSTLHDELSKSLRSRPGSILVVVDDLDRLDAAELTLVFKLIRLVGRLPKVHYLVAFDDETVIDVLGRTAIAGDDSNRARDYLEKIVQFRFDLPPIHDRQAWQLLAGRLDSVIDRWEISLPQEAIERLYGAWHDYIGRRLRSPRAINRFVDHVESVWPLLQGETDFVDVCIVTFLRTFEPRAYQLVRDSRSSLTDEIGSSPRGARPDQTVDQVRAGWREKLEAAGLSPEGCDPMIAMLSRTFPDLASRLRTSVAGRRVGDDELSRMRRVGSAEYFQRYFHLGVVPGVDIRDSIVRKAILEYAEEQGGASVDELIASLDDESTRAVWKFIRMWDEVDVADWGVVVQFAALVYSATPRGSGLLGSDVIVLTRAASDLIVSRAIADLGRTIRRSSEVEPTLRFVSDVAFNLRTRSTDEDAEVDVSSAFEQVRAAVLELVDERLETTGGGVPDDETMRILRLRSELGEPADLHEWVWSRIDDPSSPWDLSTLLSLCVPVEITPAGPPALSGRYYGSVLVTIENLLGVDRVLAVVGPLTASPEGLPHFDDDVSTENRLRYANEALARRRERKS